MAKFVIEVPDDGRPLAAVYDEVCELVRARWPHAKVSRWSAVMGALKRKG